MAVARETVRLGLARARAGEGQGAPAAARGGRRRRRARARRRSSAWPTSCATSSTSRRCASSSAADELGSYEVKPNYRTLGPRFGKAMPQVAAAVAALDPAHVAAALRDGRHGRRSTSTATSTSSAPTTCCWRMQPLEGYQLEREGSHAVALELALDDELRREGLAREVVHAVQNARKAAGLEVEDRIALALGGDDELLGAARAHEGYVAGEALADVGRLRRRRRRHAATHRGPRAAHRRRTRVATPRRLRIDRRASARVAPVRAYGRRTTPTARRTRWTSSCCATVVDAIPPGRWMSYARRVRRGGRRAAPGAAALNRRADAAGACERRAPRAARPTATIAPTALGDPGAACGASCGARA